MIRESYSDFGSWAPPPHPINNEAFLNALWHYSILSDNVADNLAPEKSSAPVQKLGRCAQYWIPSLI